MNSKLTINETLAQWKAGSLNIKDLWYDWFCKEETLKNRGDRLLRKLNTISNSAKFDKDNTYVFFKNNCPLNGSLYDDFRICDIKTNNIIYAIVPSSGHTYKKGIGEIWGNENGFEEAIIEGSWKEIKKWFLQ